MEGLTTFASAAMLCAGVHAGISPIDTPFVGEHSEDFESFERFDLQFVPFDIMGGFATMGSETGVFKALQGGDWFHQFGPVQPADGIQFATEFGSPGLTVVHFPAPVQRFGGYFGNYYAQDLVFTFFDGDGNLLGTQFVPAPADGILRWAGFGSDIPNIATVTVDNDQAAFDGLQASLIPAPGAAVLLGLGSLVSRRRRR